MNNDQDPPQQAPENDIDSGDERPDTIVVRDTEEILDHQEGREGRLNEDGEIVYAPERDEPEEEANQDQVEDADQGGEDEAVARPEDLDEHANMRVIDVPDGKLISILQSNIDFNPQILNQSTLR